MKVSLNRIEKNYHFEAKGASGVAVHIDTSLDGPSKGASPMELVLMGIAGCNAIDIVSILNKQKQEVEDYKIDIEGERKDIGGAKPFKSAHLKIYLEGKIDPTKALRAAELSFEKYCSVSLTLKGNVEVTYQVFVNGEEVK